MSHSSTELWRHARAVVDSALAEDLSWGDMTTDTLVEPGVAARAHLVSKDEGLIAGLGVALLVFERVDPALNLELISADGTRVRAGNKLARIEGSAASILKGERTALNFLQRLSGVATEAARYVEAVDGTGAVITDTRKTSPGMRVLEKYAVRVGGGRNHRSSLGDAALIKDNHLALLRAGGIPLSEALRKVRERSPHTARIEVEAQSVEQALEAIAGKADIVMLDNMSLEDIRRVVELAGGRVMLEASGGVSLLNVRTIAETGVDLISIGAITHSACAVDISLELEVL